MDIVLIDTHVLLWAASSPELLSDRARALIEDPDVVVLVSSASAWELGIKYRTGKLPIAKLIVEDFHGVLVRLKFQTLAITPLHGLAAAALQHPHRDPFDRMLVAQAIQECAVLISSDTEIQTFPNVQWLW